jgi:hypothetical protein
MMDTLTTTCSALNKALYETTTQWVEEKVDTALGEIERQKVQSRLNDGILKNLE